MRSYTSYKVREMKSDKTFTTMDRSDNSVFKLNNINTEKIENSNCYFFYSDKNGSTLKS